MKSISIQTGLLGYLVQRTKPFNAYVAADFSPQNLNHSCHLVLQQEGRSSVETPALAAARTVGEMNGPHAVHAALKWGVPGPAIEVPWARPRHQYPDCRG